MHLREGWFACVAARADVLVQSEQVVRVVAILERYQASVFCVAERLAHAVLTGEV